MNMKPLIMKIIIGQKMAKLMSNDFLDLHSIERKMFKRNDETCNLFSVIKEVVYILTEQAKSKMITIHEYIDKDLKLSLQVDS